VSNLEIPESAYRAAAKAACVDLTIYSSAPIDAAINAVAPLIVAAELRRLAKTWSSDRQPAIMHVPTSYVRQSLERRADELDPEGMTHERAI
jgi:hypothetical protein